jgi:hypothetical protein
VTSLSASPRFMWLMMMASVLDFTDRIIHGWRKGKKGILEQGRLQRHSTGVLNAAD